MSDRLTKGRTMWRAHQWKAEPVAVEVVGETAKFITVRERSPGGGSYYDSRRSKDGYFNTWAECRNAMVSNAELKMKAYQRSVHEYSTRAGQLRSLKEPS